MTDRWKDFLALAGQARDEQPPRVDVTHRVLAAIGRRGPRELTRSAERPMILCAAGALLAASVVAILASSSWIALNDPLSDFIAGLSVLNP